MANTSSRQVEGIPFLKNPYQRRRHVMRPPVVENTSEGAARIKWWRDATMLADIAAAAAGDIPTHPFGLRKKKKKATREETISGT